MSNLEQRERELQIREDQLEALRQQDRQMLEAQLRPGIHREEGVELFAWCADPIGCDDTQERVLGVRITTNKTYRDSGGDETGPMANLIQNTTVDFDFGSDEDRVCKKCGKDRQISDQERPVYGPLSGYDQKGLIEIAKNWLKTGGRPPRQAGAVFQAAKQEDERVTQLEEELAELRAMISNGSNGAPETAQPPSADLPTGVRQRTNGKFQCYWRNAAGKQRSEGGFDSAEEAAAFRATELAEVASRRTAA